MPAKSRNRRSKSPRPVLHPSSTTTTVIAPPPESLLDFYSAHESSTSSKEFSSDPESLVADPDAVDASPECTTPPSPPKKAFLSNTSPSAATVVRSPGNPVIVEDYLTPMITGRTPTKQEKAPSTPLPVAAPEETTPALAGSPAVVSADSDAPAEEAGLMPEGFSAAPLSFTYATLKSGYVVAKSFHPVLSFSGRVLERSIDAIPLKAFGLSRRLTGCDSLQSLDAALAPFLSSVDENYKLGDRVKVVSAAAEAQIEAAKEKAKVALYIEEKTRPVRRVIRAVLPVETADWLIRQIFKLAYNNVGLITNFATTAGAYATGGKKEA